MDQKVEEGMNRLVKYIRRMNQLNDEQLRLLLGVAMEKNPDSYTGIGIDIEGHVNWIRQMAMLDDDKLKSVLNKSAEDPVMQEVYEDAAKKKALLDMQKAAKDIHGNPRIFARRVDDL